MSHFTVMVVTKTDDPDELAKVLAPYDENMEVEAYWEPEDEAWQRKYYSEVCEEANLPPNGRLDPNCTGEELAAYLNARYDDDDDDKYMHDGDQLLRRSTYNPESKWDWYQVGGRWSGSLKLKDGATGETNQETRKYPGLYDTNEDPKRADRARKGDLDIEGERQRAVDKATEEWDAWEVIVTRHGLPKTFEQILTEHDIPIYAKDAREQSQEKQERDKTELEVCRTEYRDQPAVKAAQETKLVEDIFDSVDDKFVPHTRETYIEYHRLRAIAGWAFVSEDAGWVAPGHMGWFGMSSDDPGSQLGYAMKVNEIIDGLPDDAIITMVDCHI